MAVGTPRKRGRRPFGVTPRVIAAAARAASRGASDREIAAGFGISYRTFQRHLSHFDEALKRAREKSAVRLVEKVESALLKRALGYQYTEKHIEKRVIGTGPAQSVGVTSREITKEVASDPACVFFYLANRKPDRWQSINRVTKPVETENEIPVKQYLSPAIAAPAEPAGAQGEQTGH